MYSIPLCSAAKALQRLGVDLNHTLGCPADAITVLGSRHVLADHLARCFLHRDPVEVGPSLRGRLLLVGEPSVRFSPAAEANSTLVSITTR